MAHPITILGEEIPTDEKEIDINELRFYVDNPRIYSKLQGNTLFSDLKYDAEKQDYIQKEMWKEQSFKNLIPEIRKNNGLISPILVEYTNYEVIEGNSRLAAYRKLHQEDPTDTKWHKIRCYVVSNLTSDQIDAYLHVEHVKGKTEWTAYDKAHMAYKRIILDKKPLDEYAKIVGESEREIQKRIDTIQLMRDNDDKTKDHWSYYNVLVRNKIISEACKDTTETKKFLLEEIKNQKGGQESFEALELRDKFPAILSKPKILKKLMNRSLNFHDAYDRAKSSKPLDHARSAKISIESIELTDLKKLTKPELNPLSLEVKKCRQGILRLEKMIKKVEGGLNE